MAKKVRFLNENQQNKKEWIENFFNNKPLPKLDNNVDWIKVEYTNIATKNTKKILKNTDRKKNCQKKMDPSTNLSDTIYIK